MRPEEPSAPGAAGAHSGPSGADLAHARQAVGDGTEATVLSPSGRPAARSLTRASAVWAAMAAGLVLLVVVLVFILENLQEVRVSFFAAHWRIPLGVDLLLAAVLGGLVVFSAGAVRLFQLRLHARRQAHPRAKGLLHRW
ncbi:MAG: lipopolysaccharide assembly protein LapA domain-containing protein [Acidimicrobiales bacterium]